MFTSFDEKKFWQAIKDKDYLCLKVNTVSAMLNDPTFERGEITKVLKILEEQVPEIFEEYAESGYEERLERSSWNKRYFTKLTYWFQENFAKERVAYIREVGRVVHKDTAKQYAESMAIQNKSSTSKHTQPKSVQKSAPSNPTPRITTTQPKKSAPPSTTKPQEKKTANFILAGAIFAVSALVLVGILLFKLPVN